MFFNVMFFFNDTATTEIYTLSLHDALPIFRNTGDPELVKMADDTIALLAAAQQEDGYLDSYYQVDRKSTRLNSSHANISYAVFCLKKIFYLQQDKYLCKCLHKRHIEHHSST